MDYKATTSLYDGQDYTSGTWPYKYQSYVTTVSDARVAASIARALRVVSVYFLPVPLAKPVVNSPHLFILSFYRCCAKNLT